MKKKLFNLLLAGLVTASVTVTPASADASVSAGEDENGTYVLMNIPYSEFYAAEGDDEVDAVSSATKVKPRAGTLAGGSYHTKSDGSDISGVIYPVKIDDVSVLSNLKEVTDSDSYDITVSLRGNEVTTTYSGKDALFENETHAYYRLQDVPSFYKELTVTADGSFQFSKSNAPVKNVSTDATLLSGSEAQHSDYQINLSVKTADRIYGAVAHTKEGTSFGMRHIANIWRDGESGFFTGHKDKADADVEGQTLTALTYYTDEGIVNYQLNTPLYLKEFMEDGSVTAEQADEKTVTISGLPDDITDAKVSVYYTTGTGRDEKDTYLAQDAVISGGEVTLTGGTLSADKTYTVSVASSNYATVSVTLSETTWRVYNPNSGEHFFTTDTEEKDNLVKLGWHDESAAWSTPSYSEIPIYRLYNENGGEHHYTASAEEKDSLVKLGWNYEGIAFYGIDESGQPVYRLYNPNAFSNNHHFTADESEKDNLVSLGWKLEGIGFYTLP